MSTHYTATLEVNRVSRPTPPPTTDPYRRGSTPEPAPTSRDVSEVARIVIRADTLEGLAAKLSSHVDLLTE